MVVCTRMILANCQSQFRRWFVRAYGWYETEKYLYIPMEYYPLGDLKNYINKRGPIPENEAKQIAWQIAHALQIMHKEKFAHRDIKAEVRQPAYPQISFSD